MNNQINCCTKEFKVDLIELCSGCPLTELILNGIENQIIYDANIKKEVLNNEQFEAYLNSEIGSATKSITETLLNQKKHNTIDPNNYYLQVRVKNLIWNKERIKALNLMSKKSNKTEIYINPYPRIFTNNKGFSIFDKFIENINAKADFSFIFRIMINDKLIHEDIKHSEYTSFLTDKYDVVVYKIISLKDSETANKHTLYQSIKSNINAVNPK
jgi:hypothetical protein